MSRIVLLPAAAALGLMPPSVGAAAGDLSFSLRNQSTRDIHYLYAAPAGSGPSQLDVLGDNYVASGYQMSITIPGAGSDCVFDLRLVLDDGSERNAEAVDLCAAGYTLFE